MEYFIVFFHRDYNAIATCSLCTEVNIVHNTKQPSGSPPMEL